MEHEKEQAFIDAVHDRREQMYRIALGYLRNPQDAEDAVSDAVAATWKSLKRIEAAFFCSDRLLFVGFYDKIRVYIMCVPQGGVEK